MKNLKTITFLYVSTFVQSKSTENNLKVLSIFI